jgi:hypothetical protein
VTAPLVTAVIPTTGRVQLAQAVKSALLQSVPTRIVVVEADPLQHSVIEKQLDDLGDGITLIAPGQRLLASAARNLGTDAAGTPFVAYLDDDDWWHPDKVAAQLASITAIDSKRAVCTTASFFIRSDALGEAKLSDKSIVPVVPYTEGSVADYILRRPRLRYGYHFMQSSSLLLSTELAQSVRWDGRLAKHEDWDILIRLIDRHTASHVHVSQALTFVRQGSSGSMSKRAAPLESLRWVSEINCSPCTRNDFILSIVIRPALAARDMDAVRAGLRAMQWKYGMSPAAIVGLAGGLVTSVWAEC